MMLYRIIYECITTPICTRLSGKQRYTNVTITHETTDKIASRKTMQCFKVGAQKSNISFWKNTQLTLRLSTFFTKQF